MDESLDFFAEIGHAVVSGALTPAEVAAINDGIAADCAAHPEHWEPGPRPGHIAVGCDAPELLLRTEALDGLVCHPSVMPLVRRILESMDFFALRQPSPVGNHFRESP